MKRKIRIPIYLVLFCFLTIPFKSCVDSDDYDFDKLSDKVDWQPNFVAPVGYGEFTLEYLLDQHEEEGEEKTIYFEEDGIHIKYTKEDIFNYDASEVLDFPDQDPYSTSMDIPVIYTPIPIPFTSNVDLVSKTVGFNIKADDTDIILTQLELDTRITFTVTNPVNKIISLTITLDEGSIGAIDPITKNFTVTANAINQPLEWDLNGLVFNFTAPSVNNTLNVSFGATILSDDSGTIASNGNDLDITYQFGGINFILAKGDFGDQTIDIGSGDIDLDVDFWDDIDGDFTFSDPRINLRFNNQIGIPIKIDANMTASNSDGVSESLNPKSDVAELITPNYPKTEAEVLAGIDVLIPYNKDNSNVVKLLGLPPSGNMTYLGSIKINEKLDGTRFNPLVDGLNIISGNSSISADLDIDIPLNFKAENLSISDTIDEVDIDDAEKMIKAAIIITAENGLPLDVKIEHINFTDAVYNILSTISGQSIINAAAVNASGDVDTASIKKVVNKIELTAEQIKSLNDTENIILKLSVSTYNKGGESVKLKGTDKLKFTLSVNAQLDLSK